MKYLKLLNFKSEVGDYVTYHYMGLDMNKFAGSFILNEDEESICYVAYDDPLPNRVFPEGVEIISEETFNAKNQTYINNLERDRINYEIKVINLEELIKTQSVDIAQLIMQYAELDADKQKLIEEMV
ncbi:hypothetical protein J2Z69_003645 [Paenibacillus shirakamiensis]|uniref:Phage protein n=1 Tax=Paenibacillus shirakamiensis TaxID=1265935 RepID=A0ABS4JPK6_9BACL|nr:hypothetical protein [Paenibacillus shirakamiensis]MBP2002559.1 hypothetical protein [Paenibacillus shirakamiensis]